MEPDAPSPLAELSVLSQSRNQRFFHSLAARLSHVHLVLDQVDDPGNRSAVFRSADAFGLLNVHVINQRKPRESSRMVSTKAEKWLNLRGYTSPDDFVKAQERIGLCLVARRTQQSVPFSDALKNISLTHLPIYVVFGNEHEGPTPVWDGLPHQDFWIPTVGFVESLNVSVAAAISLYGITETYRHLLGASSDLSLEERRNVLALWLKRHNKRWKEPAIPFHPQLPAGPPPTAGA